MDSLALTTTISAVLNKTTTPYLLQICYKKEDLKAVLNILLRTTIIVLLVLGRTTANIWVSISTPFIAENNTNN